MPEKVIVLGGTGMLGSMVIDYLSSAPGLVVTGTVRTEGLAVKCRVLFPHVNWVLFDANTSDLSGALSVMEGHKWLINAIGITKPLIRDDNLDEIERAVRINSLLPNYIARQAQVSGTLVLQIATDCVFSGGKGEYTESDKHDALDVYGKTKSLGEVPVPQIHHLRCSIIGPEPKEHKFLLDWFLGQPRNAGVNGFVNHPWNGLTTLHFAKICHGIITNKVNLPHLQHLVPLGEINKYELLQCFARCFRREDISIMIDEASTVVDRTLKTSNEVLNKHLWIAAGYSQPPSVEEMIVELANYNFNFAGW